LLASPRQNLNIGSNCNNTLQVATKNEGSRHERSVVYNIDCILLSTVGHLNQSVTRCDRNEAIDLLRFLTLQLILSVV